MGFPVGNQVDLMLPLLGLQAVLGSAVVADTAAAQEDEDGPHQPEPWGQGGKTERHTWCEYQPEVAELRTREQVDTAHLAGASNVRLHPVNLH